MIQGKNTEPVPLSLRMIDRRRIEIYWNQEICNGEITGNYQVTNHGEICPLFEWKEDLEWNYGTVYQEEERRTTICLAEEIDTKRLEDVKVQFCGSICSKDGMPVDGNKQYPVVYEPYYSKFTTCNCGIVIKSTASVSQNVHDKAKEIIDIMMQKLPEAAKVMVQNHTELAIYGKTETAYSIPEHRIGYLVMHRPVEGFGAVMENPVGSISEVNVMRILDGPVQTRYHHELILVHEFSHGIHLIGLEFAKDKSMAERFRIIYQNAKDSGKWPRTYAISNYEEYFATLTTIWFNVMEESQDGTWNGVRGPVNTREELKVYDPEAYEFFSQIYPEVTFPEPWNTFVDRFDMNGRQK
jgi:hypothetical protein